MRSKNIEEISQGVLVVLPAKNTSRNSSSSYMKPGGSGDPIPTIVLPLQKTRLGGGKMFIL